MVNTSNHNCGKGFVEWLGELCRSILGKPEQIRYEAAQRDSWHNIMTNEIPLSIEERRRLIAEYKKDFLHIHTGESVITTINKNLRHSKFHNLQENKLQYEKCAHCGTHHSELPNCKNCGAPLNSYIENES